MQKTSASTKWHLAKVRSFAEKNLSKGGHDRLKAFADRMSTRGGDQAGAVGQVAGRITRDWKKTGKFMPYSNTKTAAMFTAFADELTKIAGFNRGFAKPVAALAGKLAPKASAGAVRGKPFTGSSLFAGGAGKRVATPSLANLNPAVKPTGT